MINIISLATPSTLVEVQQMQQFLQQNGYDSNFFDLQNNTLSQANQNCLATIPAKIRFAHFQQACNAVPNILWSARGGYGSADLLPLIANMPKPSGKKIIIAFSDLSNIANLIVKKWRWPVIMAPMLNSIIKQQASAQSVSAILAFIANKKNKLSYDLQLLAGKPQQQIITGKAVGGCLSVLAACFGTKYQLDCYRKILLLEDIDESGERLDRYFTQLLYVFAQTKNLPKAIVLGNFKHNANENRQQVIDLAIKKFAQNLNVSYPKITLWQDTAQVLGHGSEMLPFIIGAKTSIDTTTNKIKQNFYYEATK